MGYFYRKSEREKMKKTVGIMIREILIEKNIKQSALGRGICKKSALSKYLNGAWRMDRLLLTCLLQRIGKSASKFSLLLTEAENEYFEWRHQVYVAQMHCDWQKIEQLLKEKVCETYTINEVLQRQYIQIMQAFIEEKIYHNREKSIRLLEEAICTTVPDFAEGLREDTLLASHEISAILLWQNLQPDKEKSLKWVEKLLSYLRTHYDDMQEFGRLFPKVVGQYLLLLRPKKEYSTCLALSDEAIQMMIRTGYDHGMEKYLEIYIEAAECLGVKEKLVMRKKQLQASCELTRDLGYQEKDFIDELLLLDVWQEVELLQEVVAISRKEFSYSQEVLSQNICEPETISRIENGKSVPQSGIYREISKRLELPEEYYFSAVETDDFKVLELKWEMDNFVMRQQWDKAEECIVKLETMLDLNKKRNLLYLENYKVVIAEMNDLPLEQCMERLIRVLQITIPGVKKGDWKKEEFWKHYFYREEMHVLLNISDISVSLEGYAGAKNLLEGMYSYYANRRLNFDFHYRIVLLIIARLTSVCLELEQYEEAFYYVDEGIRITEICGIKRLLGGLINNKAHGLQCMGRKEEALKYYKWAAYFSDLMKAGYGAIAKRSYEKLIGHSIEWY